MEALQYKTHDQEGDVDVLENNEENLSRWETRGCTAHTACQNNKD